MPSVAQDKPKKTRVSRKKVEETPAPEAEKAPPKKRGRKPKGGKIVSISEMSGMDTAPKPNVILHLKCSLSDLAAHTTLEKAFEVNKAPPGNEVLPFQFNHQNNESTPFSLADNKPDVDYDTSSDDETESGALSNKVINKRLRELAVNLHTNNISDKKSACFHCTCDFDNPPIFIPKYVLGGSYHCYGCFCSPECAAAFLFKERIDSASLFERYHLLCHVYCRIYNYTRNIKPAPDPHYTLDKYYGNLSIQQYRQLLKNERLLLVVDKPLTRALPELHEGNSDFLLSGKSIPSSGSLELRRRTKKKTKSEILESAFNLSSAKA